VLDVIAQSTCKYAQSSFAKCDELTNFKFSRSCCCRSLSIWLRNELFSIVLSLISASLRYTSANTIAPCIISWT